MRKVFTLNLLLLSAASFSQVSDPIILSAYKQVREPVYSGIFCRPAGAFITTQSSQPLVPEVDLTRSLTGKVAGLNIQTVNRDTSKNKLFIRCGRSYTGDSQPLLIIDGVPQKLSALSDLNPYDIDSISILKGAEAGAIYGSQGMNGVIIVATKKTNKEKEPVNDIECRNYSFSVYPNPIQKGASLNLQFDNTDEKETMVRILSLDGKVLLQQKVKTAEGNNIFQLHTDNHWSAGVYFIQLLYENGQLLASEKIIIY